MPDTQTPTDTDARDAGARAALALAALGGFAVIALATVVAVLVYAGGADATGVLVVYAAVVPLLTLVGAIVVPAARFWGTL